MEYKPTDPVENPFQSPTSELSTHEAGRLVDGTQVTGKLFAPGHVGWATFLGSPFAGCVLLAINYQRMGKSSAANIAWIFAVAVIAGLLAASLVMVDQSPVQIANLILIFVMYHTAQSLQGRDFGRVMATGGTKASTWAATGIGLLCLVAFAVVAIGLDVVFFPENWMVEEREAEI